MSLQDTFTSLNRISGELGRAKTSQLDLNKLTKELGVLTKANNLEMASSRKNLQDFYKLIDTSLIRTRHNEIADKFVEANKAAANLVITQDQIKMQLEELAESNAKSGSLQRQLDLLKATTSKRDLKATDLHIERINKLGESMADNIRKITDIENQLIRAQNTGNDAQAQALSAKRTELIDKAREDEELLMSLSSGSKNTRQSELKTLAATAALEKARAAGVAENVKFYEKLARLEETSYINTHGAFLEEQKKSNQIKQYLSEIKGGLVNALEFSGVAIGLRQVQLYADALQNAQGTLVDRQKIMVQINETQALTGVEADKLLSAQKALVARGLEYNANNRQNLQTVAMLSQTFGVSEESSANIAALSTTIGENFNKLGDTVATLARNTSLSAQSIANIVEYSERIKFNTLGSNLNVVETSKAAAMFESGMNTINGPSGISNQIIEALTSYSGMSNRAYLGLNANRQDVFKDKGSFDLAVSSIVDKLNGLTKNGTDQSVIDALGKSAGGLDFIFKGLTPEAATALIRYSKALKDGTIKVNDVEVAQDALIKQFSDRQAELMKPLGNIRSRLEALAAVLVTLPMSGLARIFNWLDEFTADLVNAGKSINNFTNGGFKYFVEVVGGLSVSMWLFKAAVDASSKALAIKDLLSGGSIGKAATAIETVEGGAAAIKTASTVAGAESEMAKSVPLMAKIGKAISGAAESIFPGIGGIIKWFKGLFTETGSIARFGAFLASKLPMLEGVIPAIMSGFEAIGAVITGPVGIVLGITALSAAAYTSYKAINSHTEAIKKSNEAIQVQQAKQAESNSQIQSLVSKISQDFRSNGPLDKDMASLNSLYASMPKTAESLSMMQSAEAEIRSAANRRELHMATGKYGADEITTDPKLLKARSDEIEALLGQIHKNGVDLKSTMVETNNKTNKVNEKLQDRSDKKESNSNIIDLMNRPRYTYGTYHGVKG